ncbi:glucosamine-6-phosphate deaminase [Allorhodopirellula solitaria]|uniref:Glucosamine-6-phosphate deaminase n=1 Tax=Allorhodopirellula solitaria TaxID=2527987 RepID=A0A5C5XVJ3_9BACT|nr:glucosamine-6-phosphate deaminase [Allorhodopirellula solitaria]TWT66423.1 Glucosamine-6-phosphate deaminase [Allorhodopirellula solitaria]
MSIAYSVYPDHQTASERVADLFTNVLSSGSPTVLGLATGSTPLQVYGELCRRHRNDGLSFSQASSFNLDEYLGLESGHPQSYRHFMREHLFDHVDIDLARTHLPDVHADDAQSASDEYERQLQQSGGVDLQLLGIGTNGHIGFNEPGTKKDSLTRVVDLAPSTIDSNQRFFESPDQVPRQAITMGIASIMRAKQIVLLATGQAKAAAVAGAIQGPISADNPASYLQSHPHVHFVLDESAASELKPGDD